MIRGRHIALGLSLVLVCAALVSANPAQGQLPNQNGGGTDNVARNALMTNDGTTNPADWLTIGLSLEKRVFGSSEPVLLRFALTNTSAVSVSVLTWGTPLEGFKTDMFAVYQQGARVPYIGMLVKRGQPAPEHYLTIKPGESVSTVIDLAEGYAIRQLGEYGVAFTSALPDVRREKGAAAPNAVRIASPALSFVLTDNRPSAPGAKRKSSGFTTCSASEQQIIGDSFQAAKTYADESLFVLQNASDPATAPRYAAWFGAYTPARHSTVQNNFSALSTAFAIQGLNGFDWVCNPADCASNVFAYVYPGDPYTIYLCGAFWAANTTGTDSRAGTIIHETTHFTVIAGTQDYVYGQSAAQSLASNDPERAINNADNHEYFAENTPPLSMGTIVTPTLTLTPTPTLTPEPTATATSTPTATVATTNTPESSVTPEGPTVTPDAPTVTPQATLELTQRAFVPLAMR